MSHRRERSLTAAESQHHAIPALIYFSFAPVDPFARSLANLEAVIGQLYPATLLARLITLELETRRRL